MSSVGSPGKSCHTLTTSVMSFEMGIGQYAIYLMFLKAFLFVLLKSK